MLDSDTKRRINTCRDILVGKVPDPKSQVEQITIALIYKFMDDMDLESEEMGGARKFFTGEYERYAWAKLVAPGVGGQEMLNLYSEALIKMVGNEKLPALFRDIFRNAYLPYRDPETLRSFLREINGFSYDHSERLAVRTDDGRAVTFDTKDYAHIDHGYAATIHKAQGMTVDRAHVLATPGMDSHGAYVALSRHRYGVDLHYGRDDFADQLKLVRTLSRERGKDMASDYKPEQAFAERRGISFRERIVEIARQLPERAKSIFANFRPQANKLEALPADQGGQSDQRRAVERYARAAADIGHMREQGLPVLPHQRDALERAGQALDAIRPNASADLASALQRQPGLASEAAAGRSQGAIRAMQLEAEIRADPVQRADRFVSDWHRLGQARLAMQREGDIKGVQRITNHMAGMAKGLERDAQVESLLRNRTLELGLGKELTRELSRDLAASLSFERTRSIGMSL